MSYQIYFLQDEDDALMFLEALSELNTIVWTGNAFKLPLDLKDDIKNQISSYYGKYIIIPQTGMDILQINDREASEDMIGIEFLICCKRNALSRTFEVGRIYYRRNEDNSYDEKMILLYQQLKKFMRKNYSYSKKARIYVAPHFAQKYGENYFQASQLGRPITL